MLGELGTPSATRCRRSLTRLENSRSRNQRSRENAVTSRSGRILYCSKQYRWKYCEHDVAVFCVHVCDS